MRGVAVAVFLLRWILILVALAVSGLVTLLATEPGTRWLLAQAERHAPFDLTVEAVEGTLFRGMDLTGLQLRSDGNSVRMERARVRIDAQSLLLSTVRIPELWLDDGRVDLAGEPSEAVETGTSIALPDQVPIPFRVIVEAFRISNLDVHRAGQHLFTVDALTLQLDANSERVRVTALELAMPEIELALDAWIQPSGMYPLAVDARWRRGLPDELAASLAVAAAEGSAQLTGNLGEQLNLEHHLRAGIELDTTVSATDLLGTPRFTMRNQWQAFRFGFGNDRIYDVAAGTLDLQGTPDDWRARVAGGLGLDDWPPIEWRGTALGSLQHIEIPELTLGSEAGTLTSRGRIERADGLAWTLSLVGQDFDPGAVFPEWSGQLTLALNAKGHIPFDEERHVSVDLSGLGGTLRGAPIDGSARVELHGNRLHIERFELGMGENRINVQGRVDETLQLDLTVTAPELERVLPELSGSIHLDGAVSGTRASPRISAQATGSMLRLQSWSLDAFELVLEAGIDREAPVNSTLRITGLGFDGTTIPEASIQVSGQADAHRVRARLDSPDLGPVAIEATGVYDVDSGRWSGVLEGLDLDHPLAGPWALRGPASLNAGAKEAAIEGFCLGREDTRVCLSADWSGVDGVRAQGSVDAFDLAWLAPILPEEIAIDGTLDLRLDGSVDSSGIVRGTLLVPPTEGVLRNVFDADAEQAFPYRNFQFDLRVEDRLIEAKGGLSFLDAGSARVELRLRPEDDSYSIEGKVHAALDDLAWATGLSPKVSDIRGRMNVDLALGGTLAEPTVAGRANLADGHVVIPEAGLELEIPSLAAEIRSTSAIQLSGILRSGDENLYVEGTLGFTPEHGTHAEIWVHGENVLALNRPDVSIRISPDLTLVLDANRLSVRGEIIVPWARILPPDLPPGAIAVSRDAIVVGEEGEDSGAGLPLDIRIRILLGQDVRLDAFGLSASLTGDVDVIDIEGRPTQILGEISILEGQYRAYGQTLNVEQGLILFRGPPDNPDLDIRAVREIPQFSVIAGLEVTGTPRQLQSRIFSEPPMDDTEALAFLVTGRPLSGTSEADGNLLASAAAAWGLERGNLITQRLGSELGLDMVEIDTSGGLDQSALTLGKYLSPRLLLRYSINLFDNSSRVTLRFELTPSLSLETTSSALSQAIDLIYRIER